MMSAKMPSKIAKRPNDGSDNREMITATEIIMDFP
jgi:hypothetical protein